MGLRFLKPTLILLIILRSVKMKEHSVILGKACVTVRSLEGIRATPYLPDHLLPDGM